LCSIIYVFIDFFILCLFVFFCVSFQIAVFSDGSSSSQDLFIGVGHRSLRSETQLVQRHSAAASTEAPLHDSRPEDQRLRAHRRNESNKQSVVLITRARSSSLSFFVQLQVPLIAIDRATI
jgi:hypothetical protein